VIAEDAMPIARRAAFALMLAIGAPSAAAAAPFDVIYSDHMLVLIPPGSTITSETGDFMLFVNKSGVPLGSAELAGLKVSANVRELSVHVETPVLLQNLTGPIEPGEAVGALGSSGGGFEDRLLPSETLQDLAPQSLFELRVDPGTYPSPASCEFTVQLGADVAVFSAHLHLIQGSDAVIYMTTARVSSSRPVPVKLTRWGRVKAAYR
jgi:hypothetical protein